ncbi:Growth-regulating factor 4 [Olea europaea subsp. europaea]|uniref:Growth-regulating factor 4 n=1 Tax=Olea europaea subsp. europaea TaxID=158383 RepID=A0A8S0RBS9_OLEEU|nr:Growth-regulating factor 4 [Olea europaea subsp. europaea]
MSRQQEEFMQQYYQQMNYVQMTEMLQLQDLMQQQDQQQSYAHRMAVIPHQEEAFKHQQLQEQSTVGHDSKNPLGNPFIEQESKPCLSQDQPSEVTVSVSPHEPQPKKYMSGSSALTQLWWSLDVDTAVKHSPENIISGDMKN